MSLDERWNKEAERMLLGMKVDSVKYMSQADADASMWSSRPVVIRLTPVDPMDERSGVEVCPMRDDEGNDGGALAVGQDVLPVL